MMNRLPVALQYVTRLKGTIKFCSESTRRDVVRTRLSRGPALNDFVKSSAAGTDTHAQCERTPYLQEHDLAAKGRKGIMSDTGALPLWKKWSSCRGDGQAVES